MHATSQLYAAAQRTHRNTLLYLSLASVSCPRPGTLVAREQSQQSVACSQHVQYQHACCQLVSIRGVCVAMHSNVPTRAALQCSCSSVCTKWSSASCCCWCCKSAHCHKHGGPCALCCLLAHVTIAPVCAGPYVSLLCACLQHYRSCACLLLHKSAACMLGVCFMHPF